MSMDRRTDRTDELQAALRMLLDDPEEAYARTRAHVLLDELVGPSRARAEADERAWAASAPAQQPASVPDWQRYYSR